MSYRITHNDNSVEVDSSAAVVKHVKDSDPGEYVIEFAPGNPDTPFARLGIFTKDPNGQTVIELEEGAPPISDWP